MKLIENVLKLVIKIISVIQYLVNVVVPLKVIGKCLLMFCLFSDKNIYIAEMTPKGRLNRRQKFSIAECTKSFIVGVKVKYQ